jgi:hypothetical protein
MGAAMRMVLVIVRIRGWGFGGSARRFRVDMLGQGWCNCQSHQETCVSEPGSHLSNHGFCRLHTTVQTATRAILTPGLKNSSSVRGWRLGLAVAVETPVGRADAAGCGDLLSQRLSGPVHAHAGVV